MSSVMRVAGAHTPLWLLCVAQSLCKPCPGVIIEYGIQASEHDSLGPSDSLQDFYNKMRLTIYHSAFLRRR